jgi:hypothetical protein
MYEYIKTVQGWKLCWGGAPLYAEKAVPAPRAVIRAAEALAAASAAGDRAPPKVLAA